LVKPGRTPCAAQAWPRGASLSWHQRARCSLPEGAPDLSERSGVARTTVTFRTLGTREIDRYVESGEWRDRAGGYAVQGLGASLVEKIEGDLSNVIGLPLGLLLDLEPDLGT